MTCLTLLRRVFTSKETVGTLLLDDTELCSTIEPPVRPTSQHPKGAIPMGWYEMSVTHSPRFSRALPLLRLVPGFEGVRIHAGNSSRDTAGCVLVGELPDKAWQEPVGEGRWRLLESRKTETGVTELIKQLLRDGQVYLYITDIERHNAELCKSNQECHSFLRRYAVATPLG